MKMNWLKPAVWASVTACCAFAALSAGQLPPVDPGEKIVNTVCTTCHELRQIETTALDKEGWTKVVNAMKEKGADIKNEDVPSVVNFLSAAYGPLPEGPGKAIMLNVCTQCHSLDRVKARVANADEWSELLLHMLNEGAPLSDSDFRVLLNYLARYFAQ